ncbi:DNA-binding bromodomain-containing protein [Forsythia ovata]|uniref:DNA-binding bromodomain-containing protein n=1 Tax=Forsythia ovata TaxID=205694 RepID=A0ABD1R7G9_9LAMI
MAKPDGTVPNNFDKPEAGEGDDESLRWGTWEELLLAFAVNRYGTGRWESVASELQKRSSDPTLPVLTPQNCKQRYVDLKRRYLTQNDTVNDKLLNDDNVDGGDSRDSVPLLEELRKLRVAELRREVQRYDLNIESLEFKMKRMEEEREGSLRSEKNSEENSDLEKKSEEKRKDDEVEPEEKAWQQSMAGEPVAGNESEKDHMSVNESNSTDLDGEKVRTGEKESEPDRTGEFKKQSDRTGDAREEPVDLKAESDRTGEGKPVREESCNGSSDSIEKDSVREVKVERTSDSVGLVESEAESKGGGDEAAKESSDVQSSASRSKKEEENDKIHRVSMSGDERDHGDQSGTVKHLLAASQPLLDLLQSIRAHKSGSVFERRLQSQENSKYRNLIRQHIDLESIESRLKEGWYSGSSSKFFRDLLLLVNNALVFFKKNSSEFLAATELRQIISKEMSQKYAKSDSSSGKQISLQSLTGPKKEDPEPSRSLLLKPRIAGSLIICRKRSSIAAKASASSSGADRKKEQTPLLAEEKDTKLQACQSSANTEEPKITKKRTRDRFAPVSANSKKINSNKNQGSSNINKNLVLESGKNQGKAGSSSNHPEPKSENKKNQSTSDSKKRSAASFLNRMKQSSSSNNGGLLDALKNTPLTTSDSNNTRGGSEQKKNDNGKRGEKKEQVPRRNSEPRQRKEKGSPAKRSVGRPPKREAAPPPSVGKRGRGETEASKQPKKRSRKL